MENQKSAATIISLWLSFILYALSAIVLYQYLFYRFLYNFLSPSLELINFSIFLFPICALLLTLLMGLLKYKNWARVTCIRTGIFFLLWGWGVLFAGANPWRLEGLGGIAYYINPALVIPIVIYLTRPKIKQKFIRDDKCLLPAKKIFFLVSAVLIIFFIFSWLIDYIDRQAARKYLIKMLDCYQSKDVHCLRRILKDSSAGEFILFPIASYKISKSEFEPSNKGFIGKIIQILYSADQAKFAVDFDFKNNNYIPEFYKGSFYVTLVKPTHSINYQWNIAGDPFDKNPPHDETITLATLEDVSKLIEKYKNITDNELIEIIMYDSNKLSAHPFLWTWAKRRNLVIPDSYIGNN